MISMTPNFATGKPDRVVYWREVVGHTVMRLDVAPLTSQSRFTVRVFPGLVSFWESAGGLRLLGSPELFADNRNHLLLTLVIAGRSVVSVRGREITLSSGDAFLVPNCDLGAVTFLGPARYMSVRGPRQVLLRSTSGFEDIILRPMARDSEALRLLRSYMTMLSERPVPTVSEVHRAVVTHVHELATLVIGAAQTAAATADRRGIRTARLGAIKADIAAHLGEFDFSVRAAATHLHVSPRYIQMLFESGGTTFSEYVLEQRLVRSHWMLTDPAYAGWSITAIALEAGFGNLSHFNHAFRRIYAASPSNVRAAAQCKDCGRQ